MNLIGVDVGGSAVKLGVIETGGRVVCERSVPAGDLRETTALFATIADAVRALEGKLEVKHAGPAIVLIDSDNVDRIGSDGSLAPASFVPTFTVE